MRQVGSMDGFVIHASFDVLAWLAAGAAALWLSRTGRVSFPVPQPLRLAYLAALMFGAGVGAVALRQRQSVALRRSPGSPARSRARSRARIVAIEIYKRIAGIAVRTGARFALPFAVGVAVGRIGCFLSGLDDFTYGTPTSAALGARLRRRRAAPSGAALRERRDGGVRGGLRAGVCSRRDRFFIENGFYLAVGFYGAQRFAWEFLKPYGTLIGPFTLFHLLSAAVLALRGRDDRDGAKIRECP